ncbi:methylated-DNA--[protein]-cysteine S-methyltransferase [Thermaurantiacus sp.]
MLSRSTLPTPLGLLVLVHDDEGLLWAAEFHEDAAAIGASLARFGQEPLIEADVPLPPHLKEAFLGYFARAFDSFDEVMTGRFGTPFERAVWAAVRAIPPGETRSDRAIATLLGDPAKARAVGAGLARNPLAIIVPCHRVVGSAGELIGDASGLERRAWLLRHEGWRPPLGRP